SFLQSDSARRSAAIIIISLLASCSLLPPSRSFSPRRRPQSPSLIATCTRLRDAHARFCSLLPPSFSARFRNRDVPGVESSRHRLHRPSTMRFSAIQALLGSATILLSAPGCEATSTHRQLHHLQRKSSHHSHGSVHSRAEVGLLENAKRGGLCPFPSDDPNLVAVTPNAKNAGWAMSPDQECKPGSYCPIACKPGMVMAQWEPDSTYNYPQSMNGGLYCDGGGKIRKPFPNKPNCVPGTGAVKVINKCKSQMSWCQTVLPGNEAMLIPTLVDSEVTLAVPNTDYWCSTAAHFYINPPGTGLEGCVWGDSSTPVGNWSPFVAGANTDSSGQTFVKLGWNPIWESSALRSNTPGFGVKIECPDGGCNGLPCSIDPSGGIGRVDSKLAAIGAGDSAFCVVTVAKGKTASIIAFDGSGGLQHAYQEPPTPQSTTKQQPTTSSTHTSTSTTAATSSVPTTTATYAAELSTTRKPARPTPMPAIFQENGTAYHPSETSSQFAAQTTSNGAPKTTEKKGEAGRQQGSAAVAGLVVAFIAAACFF
ncbi:secreted beta-glucosidase adg3, partial [Tolypocladium capitatum]